jgi:hypothetical protein
VDTGNIFPTDVTITNNVVSGTLGPATSACFEEGTGIGPILVAYTQWSWFGLSALPQRLFKTELDDCSQTTISCCIQGWRSVQIPVRATRTPSTEGT